MYLVLNFKPRIVGAFFMFDYHEHFNKRDETHSIETRGLVNISVDDFLNYKSSLDKHCLSLMFIPEQYLNFSDEKIKNYFQIIENLLNDNPSLQIGEIGLDSRFYYVYPKDRQCDIFKNLLSLACTYKRDITIHCVKENNTIYECVKNLNLKGIFHSFHSSFEFAFQLKKVGIRVALNPRYSYTDDYLSKMKTIDAVIESDCGLFKTADEYRILEEFYKRYERI